MKPAGRRSAEQLAACEADDLAGHEPAVVAGQKDVVMRPSERMDFERDLAVVNDSIQKMRQEVRKNPKVIEAYLGEEKKIEPQNPAAADS